jgi:hypothetical protein
MRAAWHTETMLAAWRSARVGRADLALRQPSGAMLWQADLALEDLPLAWARAENAHGADIYIRPARGLDWPMVFLDDVAPLVAEQTARAHGGLAILTSPAGGCHLWLPCERPLDEAERHQTQRNLAGRLGGDLGSVSGEHLGRLAGFKNWKRGGCWVNVVFQPGWAPGAAPLPVPAEALQPDPRRRNPALNTSAPAARSGRDGSPSGQEWGWVCRMLESGCRPEDAYWALVEKARERRGEDAERYARRTVERAMANVRGQLG